MSLQIIMSINLNHNEQFAKSFTKDVIFICGKQTTWGDTSTNLDILLNSFTERGDAIIFSYFLNPQANIINYLEENLDSQNYTIVNEIKEIDIKNIITSKGIVNIILSGFNPMDKIYNRLIGVNSSILIFFKKKLTSPQRNKWEKRFDIEIVEQDIDSYIEERHTHRSYKSHVSIPDIVPLYGRALELDLHRKFVENKEKRICLILGFEGMGKRTFIKKLQSDFEIKNSITYNFQESLPFSKFIKELFKLFNYTPLEDEIPTELNKKILPQTIKGLFEIFDSVKGGSLIFENIGILCSKEEGSFTDESYEHFFLNFVKRPSYRGNKVYFISTRKPNIKKIEWLNHISTIEIRPLNNSAILNVIESQYLQNNVSSTQESKDEDIKILMSEIRSEELLFLTGGLPLLAQLAVNEDAFVDSSFVEDYLTLKNDFVLTNLNITKEEETLLKFLVQFDDTFGITQIKELQPEPARIIKSLKSKMIMEDKSSGVYRIPIFIRDAILSMMDEKVTRIYATRRTELKHKQFNALKIK